MRKKEITESIEVPIVCVCAREERFSVTTRIIEGSNNGQNFTPQEIFCRKCKDQDHVVRLIIEVPGIVPPDYITRG